MGRLVFWIGVLTVGLAGAASFEVASVKPHRGAVMRSGPLVVSGPLIRLEGYTIYGLVMDAYGLRDFQLSFGKLTHPEDVMDDMYDVTARAPGGKDPGLAEVRSMLQGLMGERFGLKTHWEPKDMPVYALVTAKGGARLKPHSGEGVCEVKAGVGEDGRSRRETFRNCPVERLADRVGNLMGQPRPVMDETGLAGGYDFELTMTPEYQRRGGDGADDVSAATALARLGLRLVGKRGTVKTLVVDDWRKPAGN